VAGEAALVGGGIEDAVGQGAQQSPPLGPLDEFKFHRDPRYGGDLHRANMAWGGMSPPWGCRPVRFARRSCRCATLPRRAAQNVSANMRNGPQARRSGRRSRGGTTGNRRQPAAFYCRIFAPPQPVYPVQSFQ
jgi:hypothetical protein